MGYIYYCPVCGCDQFRDAAKCTHCYNPVRPVQSRYEYEYYQRKAFMQYGSSSEWKRVLQEEEVKYHPLYNGRTASQRKTTQEIEQHNKEILDNLASKQLEQLKYSASTNQPKCPTCNSANIQRISTLKRATHGYLFGIFSNTARSQFECLNCKYKW